MTPELEAAYADLAAVARSIDKGFSRLDLDVGYMVVGVAKLQRLRAAIERVAEAERGTT